MKVIYPVVAKKMKSSNGAHPISDQLTQLFRVCIEIRVIHGEWSYELGERLGSGDGERKTLLTRQIAFEPLPASVLFGLVVTGAHLMSSGLWKATLSKESSRL